MTNKEVGLLNVDWFITRNCDQARYCGFCFAPWHAFPRDSNFDEAESVCNRLSELKVETVTLCGGEPTLYPRIADIVQCLHSFGIKVVFYTNLATNFDVPSLFPYIQVLSIPIDAFSPAVIRKMRGLHQFEGVCRMLEVLRSSIPCPVVKVGTIVSLPNIDDLENIFGFIKKSGVVDIWRLYQFSPCGIGKKNEHLFLLEDDKFYGAVDRIKSLANGSTIDIAERSRNDAIGYCHIMDSVGQFYRYEEEYISLGTTIFDDPRKIAAGYDNSKNERQKMWHHLTRNVRRGYV